MNLETRRRVRVRREGLRISQCVTLCDAALIRHSRETRNLSPIRHDTTEMYSADLSPQALPERGKCRNQLKTDPVVARQAIADRANAAIPMLVDGVPGIAVAPEGRLLLALKISIVDGRVVEIDVVADPERLERLELAVL